MDFAEICLISWFACNVLDTSLIDPRALSMPRYEHETADSQKKKKKTNAHRCLSIVDVRACTYIHTSKEKSRSKTPGDLFRSIQKAEAKHANNQQTVHAFCQLNECLEFKALCRTTNKHLWATLHDDGGGGGQRQADSQDTVICLCPTLPLFRQSHDTMFPSAILYQES